MSQEHESIASGALGFVGAAALALALSGAAGAWLLLGRFTDGQGVMRGNPRPTVGRAEPAHIERTQFRRANVAAEAAASAEARLRSSGYVDRTSRVVHIPIDRAIELYVELYGTEGRSAEARRGSP